MGTFGYGPRDSDDAMDLEAEVESKIGRVVLKMYKVTPENNERFGTHGDLYARVGIVLTMIENWQVRVPAPVVRAALRDLKAIKASNYPEGFSEPKEVRAEIDKAIALLSRPNPGTKRTDDIFPYEFEDKNAEDKP